METFSNIKKNIYNKFITTTNDIRAKPEILILPIFLIILFSTISYFIFNQNVRQFINKKFELNKEFLNKKNNINKNITIMYFYTEWCPYCKISKPEWQSFKELIDLQSYKEQIIFKEIDCDENPDIANQYKIEGYPTIKLIYKGEVYDYDAKPESKTLLQFLESIIVPN